MGEEFAKLLGDLGRHARMTPHQISVLRRGGGLLGQIDRTVQGWSGISSPDPYFPMLRFRQAEGEILPHDYAAMLGDDTPVQSIPTGVWTTVTFDATNPVTVAKGGMRIDTANNRIYVDGVERESVVLAVGWADWAYNTTGLRGISWLADDTSARYVI